MFKVFVEKQVSRELERFSGKLKARIKEKLKILEDGFSFALDIKKLKGYQNHYRLRVGDLRILFYLEGMSIIVYKIGKRESIYE
ncbi:MAG: type II toxin-antitoxin system RelE/ParE family toxin [Candidatus Aenigmarchaeota archaeon]|nr:type II toxin-antitoxin system RelE/ParE family toxin [Candidatus Aenigmarchaeota archaeon]